MSNTTEIKGDQYFSYLHGGAVAQEYLLHEAIFQSRDRI